MPSGSPSEYVSSLLLFREANSIIVQASKGHALGDPFDCLGQADLSANVDFAYVDVSRFSHILCEEVTARSAPIAHLYSTCGYQSVGRSQCHLAVNSSTG